MQTLTTIIPIFLVIAIGAIARRHGYIPTSFLSPANRLVYYLSIPAMIFRAVAKSSPSADLNPTVLIIVLSVWVMIYLLALQVAHLLAIHQNRRGTFIQCAFRGNIGYIGLAVIFYYFGDIGLIKGSILAGFIMIFQNLLAVLALQDASQKRDPKWLRIYIGRVLVNPIILSALLGIGYAALGLPLPIILDRCLEIISAMALPLALLLIGASLSFSLMKNEFRDAFLASMLKLIMMPAIGWLIFHNLNILPEEYIPGLILLATPTATLSYVFCMEMNGVPDLAAATISLSTIFSAVTLAFWIFLAT